MTSLKEAGTRLPILVSRLAYLGIATDNLDAWDHYARAVLGVHVEREAGELRLRLDDKHCRMRVQQQARNGASFFGWEIADGMALETVAARLDQAAVPTAWGDEAECAQRGVGAFIWFRDPLGNRVEICRDHAAASAEEPLRLSRPLSGFKTGRLGLGHVVLMHSDVDAARHFYTEVLGMRLSDYTERPFDAQFYHINERHHSFAIIRNARKGMHHLMLELLELDDVGQTYDLLEVEGVRLGASLGRHANDHMTSFYMFTPSGFMIEYGWGGRAIDVDEWHAEKMDCGPSLWGHDRTWLDDAVRQEAAAMRRHGARQGLKAKVSVTPGHFVATPEE